MKVENKISIEEIDGVETSGAWPGYPQLSVSNHQLQHLVIIECDNGKSYTVNAAELSRAISNAINHI